jgi:hypothetical protein
MISKSLIIKVVHDEEDDWQFLSSHGADMEKVMLVSLSQILEIDHTLSEIASLPSGKQAVRNDISEKWIISNIN